MDLSTLDQMVYILDSIRNDFRTQKETLSNKLPVVPLVVITGTTSNEVTIISDPIINSKSASIGIRKPPRRFNISGRFSTQKSTKVEGSSDINANIYTKMSSEKSLEKISPLRSLIRPGLQSLCNRPSTLKAEVKPSLAASGRQASCLTPGEKLRSSFQRLVTSKETPIQPTRNGQAKVLTKAISLQKKEPPAKDFQTAQLNRRSIGQGLATSSNSMKSAFSGAGIKRPPSVITTGLQSKGVVAEKKTLVRSTTSIAPSSSFTRLSNVSLQQSPRPRAASAVIPRKTPSSNSGVSIAKTLKSSDDISAGSHKGSEPRPRPPSTNVFRAAFQRASTNLGLANSLQSKMSSSIKVSTSSKSLKSESSLANVGEGTKLFRSSSLRGPLKMGSITLSPLLQAATKSPLPAEIRKVVRSSTTDTTPGPLSGRNTLKSTASRVQRAPLSLVHSASESAKKKARVPTVAATTRSVPKSSTSSGNGTIPRASKK